MTEDNKIKPVNLAALDRQKEMERIVREMMGKERIMPLKWIQAILLSLLLVLTLAISIPVYLSLKQYDVLKISKFVSDVAEVEQGGRLCFVMEAEKMYDVPVFATVDMVNGEAVQVMKYSTHHSAGTLNVKRCFKAEICPGEYVIRWTGRYPMNAFNNSNETVETQTKVTVVKASQHQGIQGIQGKQGVPGKTGGIEFNINRSGK